MKPTPRVFFTVGALLLTFMAAGCAKPTPEQRASGEIFDPFEKGNRNVHEFNRKVDKVLFRPVSKGYVGIIPRPMLDSVNYFADNIGMPSNMVDFLLQGNFREAGIATARFLINSTIGFGGLADPATEFGIPATDTDFGETLYVWGVEDGAYLELPFFGPSNERDAVGLFVALFTNPVSFTLTRPVNNIRVYAELFSMMGDRGQFSDTVDSILYESADSYAQSRLIYSQNRRFELAGDSGEDYVDPYSDSSADPYDDPYAQ